MKTPKPSPLTPTKTTFICFIYIISLSSVCLISSAASSGEKKSTPQKNHYHTDHLFRPHRSFFKTTISPVTTSTSTLDIYNTRGGGRSEEDESKIIGADIFVGAATSTSKRTTSISIEQQQQQQQIQEDVMSLEIPDTFSMAKESTSDTSQIFYREQREEEEKTDDTVDDSTGTLLQNDDIHEERPQTSNKNNDVVRFDNDIDPSLLMNPPGVGLARKHLEEQYQQTFEYMEHNEHENDTISSYTSSTEDWILSFQEEIQKIRMEIEKESELALESTKNEVLELIENVKREKEQQRRALELELEMELELELEPSISVESTTTNTEFEEDEIIDRLLSQEKEKETTEVEGVDESESDVSSEIDQVQDNNIIMPILPETEDDKDADYYDFLVGDTDESDMDVVNRLHKTKAKKSRDSSSVVDADELKEKLNDSDSEEKVVISSDVPKKKKRSTSKNAMKKKRTEPIEDILSKKSSSTITKTMNKKKKRKKQKSISSKKEDTTLSVTDTKNSKETFITTTPSLKRRIVGRLIQALILLFIFGLSAHVVFSENGLLDDPRGMLKHLFMPFLQQI